LRKTPAPIDYDIMVNNNRLDEIDHI